MSELAIELKNVSKTFKVGFSRKKFLAVTNLNLDVKKGEVLGYLGPNGAGKTTTFKLILGLMRPDSGIISFWGKPAQGVINRKEIGFLPENPYFYAYLTPLESLDFYARLFDIEKKERLNRSNELIKLVSLEHAKNLQLRKFSRGMLQRLGIAQALINNPNILILDEPMLGLDPMGRREMRDIILKCKEIGKTVIFSTHILSDVEMICDRAAILFNGQFQTIIDVDEAIEKKVLFYEMIYTGLNEKIISEVDHNMYNSKKVGNHYLLKIQNDEEANNIMGKIISKGGKIISFTPHRERIEDILVNKTKGSFDRWGK